MKAKIIVLGVIFLVTASISGFASNSPNEATEVTRQLNAAVLGELPFEDNQDFLDAQRGFMGTISDPVIKNSDGNIVWNLNSFEFLKNDPPPTVNPSLWRQAQLNNFNGLFKVTDRVYQVRGLDLSNMTIIEGNTGLIITDPLTAKETAQAALNLYYEHRPKKPVIAVIYTHSHVDHFGGVKGVVNEQDVKTGKVKIIAPEGFLTEAVSENIYAGNAMSRRAMYMYASILERGPTGHVDSGLGKTTPRGGEITLIAPTDIIKKTGEKRVIDGVEIEFQMAPDTEAPAEMFMYYPQFKLLNMSEDTCHTLHNLYTLRGAQIRDPGKWWKSIDEAIDAYANKTNIMIVQHHWPVWRQDKITTYLKKQRNTYKYIQDQSLRLMNLGYTGVEIAEMINMPESLAHNWYARGYYGTLNHNVKAVYQRYLGWYDGNPANLYPLPPKEAAVRYVDFMGGAANAIAKAREYYAKNDYRFVAEVMKHVIFADPDNQEARNLAADALEQLGYQAESGTWRANFLMGSYELRNGAPQGKFLSTVSKDILSAMSNEMMLEYLSIKLNASKTQGKMISINWHNTDNNELFNTKIEDSTLIYKIGKLDDKADVTVYLTSDEFHNIILGQTNLEKEIESGQIRLVGDKKKFAEFIDFFDTPAMNFNIVTPRE